MEKDGFKFDLETQRFLVNRWETEVGQRVRLEVLQGLKNSVEVRAILDQYVLNHEANVEPYGYPIYPSEAMQRDDFWVLTQDDLRGIRFYNEDISNSPSFEKKSLSYASFYNCNLSGSNLEMTDLSYARIEKCNLSKAVFAASGGFGVRIVNSTAAGACFWQCGFRDCDVSGTDFRGSYFEGALIEDLKVDYRTQFDLPLCESWKSRTIPKEEVPDLLRSLRIAYERAELWISADRFMYEERVSQRQYLLWPHFVSNRSWSNFLAWFISLVSAAVSGYVTKPGRVLAWGGALVAGFGAFYFAVGPPTPHQTTQAMVYEALYLSLTTFATLGFGDVTYDNGQPLLRLLTSGEAVVGAIWISLFVVVLAKKILR